MKSAIVKFTGEDSHELADRLIPSQVEEVSILMPTGHSKTVSREHAIVTFGNALGVSDDALVTMTADSARIRSWFFEW